MRAAEVLLMALMMLVLLLSGTRGVRAREVERSKGHGRGERSNDALPGSTRQAQNEQLMKDKELSFWTGHSSESSVVKEATVLRRLQR